MPRYVAFDVDGRVLGWGNARQRYRALHNLRDRFGPCRVERTWMNRGLLGLWDQDDGVCHLCEERVEIELPREHPGAASADHVRPKSVGGQRPGNLRLAHRWCNSRRGSDGLESGGPAFYAAGLEQAIANFERPTAVLR